MICSRFLFSLGEIQVKFATKKLACEIRCNTLIYYGIQVSDVNKNIKNPSTDVFCSLSIRAAVMACPESELSAQALPSSLVATQPNTSSEAITKKTFIAHVLVGNLFFRFVEPMFLPSVDLNHLCGCDEWQASGCKACFKRQRPDTWHKGSKRASRPLKGFLLFFSSSNILEKVEYIMVRMGRFHRDVLRNSLSHPLILVNHFLQRPIQSLY